MSRWKRDKKCVVIKTCRFRQIGLTLISHAFFEAINRYSAEYYILTPSLNIHIFHEYLADFSVKFNKKKASFHEFSDAIFSKIKFSQSQPLIGKKGNSHHLSDISPKSRTAFAIEILIHPDGLRKFFCESWSHERCNTFVIHSFSLMKTVF